MYTGDGSGDYCGVLAAKLQQSHPQPHDDLIAVHLPSSAVHPDDPSAQQLQQSRGELGHAIEGAPPSGRLPGNTHMQPQLANTPAEQQAQHNGSSRQLRRLPGQQQVQAAQHQLQPLQHQHVQLGGQQAVVDGQPQGQSEEGRPSGQTERATGQKKAMKKKKTPSQQGDVKGLECERVARWGHDKFQETQVFIICYTLSSASWCCDSAHFTNHFDTCSWCLPV